MSVVDIVSLERIMLVLVLKELDIVPLHLPDKRSLLHTKMYLLQEMGLNLGYIFYWYLAGPYSPALTADAHTVLSECLDEVEDYSVNDAASEIIQRINNMARNRPSTISETMWYELLACTHYLLKKINIPHESVFTCLCSRKLKFLNMEGEFKEALMTLIRVGEKYPVKFVRVE